MRRQLLTATISLGFLSTIFATQQACSIASDTIVNTKEGEQTSKKDAGPKQDSPDGDEPKPEGPATCKTDDWATPDLAKLKACGDGKGKGHCYDKTKMSVANLFVACADAKEVCVPDEILLAVGKPLKSCKSLIGPGGCLSAGLIPEIEKQGGSVLTKDICDEQQKCVPCNDPQSNNAPTPFCQPIGVHTNACGAAGAAPGGDAGAGTPSEACCVTNGKANGVCMMVPEAERDSAPKDTCSGETQCAPAALVMGKQVKCDAGIVGDGICMDKCFNKMMGFAATIGVLNTEGCGSTEVCVPCLAMKNRSVPVPGCN